ncbi:hypothetical protein HK405_000995, partial [Cladochytrium tenue]
PLADRPVTLVYIPTIANSQQVPAFSPSAFSFMKLNYTADECDGLFRCAELNWGRARDTVREVLRAAWIKKRDARLATA